MMVVQVNTAESLSSCNAEDDRFMEHTCNARFMSEKLSVYRSAKQVVDQAGFTDTYIMRLYECDDDRKLGAWVDDTILDPVATLIKHTLIAGFYDSHTTDLHHFVSHRLESLVKYTMKRHIFTQFVVCKVATPQHNFYVNIRVGYHHRRSPVYH